MTQGQKQRELYGVPSWEDVKRREHQLNEIKQRAAERKHQKDEQELLKEAEEYVKRESVWHGFRLVPKKKMNSLLADNEISEVAKMQRLIDGYEQCIVATWGMLHRTENFVAVLPDSDCTDYINSIWQFLDFVKQKHPNIIMEWLNNK